MTWEQYLEEKKRIMLADVPTLKEIHEHYFRDAEMLISMLYNGKHRKGETHKAHGEISTDLALVRLAYERLEELRGV